MGSINDLPPAGGHKLGRSSSSVVSGTSQSARETHKNSLPRFFLLPKLISTILNATNFMPQFEEEKKLLNIWLKEKNIYFEYIKTEA